MHANPLQCLTLTVLLLPPVLLTTYWVATYPNPPKTLALHSSLASLPLSNPARLIYPETFYDGGAYVTLPYGRVRYWLVGPETGKRVVLIHGLSIPAIVFQHIVPLLTAANYRVLIYDLYGRGYSDAPQLTYDPALYATQLALLMQHIKWDSARITGLSMGGGIAAYFTQAFPWLVDGKVALLASSGLMQSTDISRTVKLMSSPLAQMFTSTFVRSYLQRLANSTTEAPPDEIRDIVRFQSAYLPGYNMAVASSIRDGPVRGLQKVFENVGRTGNSVLIIHGTEDHTVPYRYSKEIQSLIRTGAASLEDSEAPPPTFAQIAFGATKGKPRRKPTCELITLEGGKHDFVLDRAEEAGNHLIRFFSED